MKVWQCVCGTGWVHSEGVDKINSEEVGHMRWVRLGKFYSKVPMSLCVVAGRALDALGAKV